MSYSLMIYKNKKEIEDNKKINKTFTEAITHKTRKLEGLQTNKRNN